MAGAASVPSGRLHLASPPQAPQAAKFFVLDGTLEGPHSSRISPDPWQPFTHERGWGRAS